MACLSPRYQVRSEGGSLHLADSFEVPGWPEGLGPRPAHVREIPCGGCSECRLTKVRDLAACGILEWESAKGRSSFVTLTFDEAHYPADGSLAKPVADLFLQRVRDRMGPFRYAFCGEYGGKTSRAHYHAALFGVPFDDCEPSVLDAGRLTSPTLQRMWPFGNVIVSEIVREHVGYTLGYAAKKAPGRLSAAENVRFDSETLDVEIRKPSFHLTSTAGGFGLGAPGAERFLEELIDSGEIACLNRPWEGPGLPPEEDWGKGVIPYRVMARLAEVNPEAFVRISADRREKAEIARFVNPPEFRESRREARQAEYRKRFGDRSDEVFDESRLNYEAHRLVDEVVDPSFDGLIHAGNPALHVVGLTAARAKRVADAAAERSLPSVKRAGALKFSNWGAERPSDPEPAKRVRLTDRERKVRRQAADAAVRLRAVARRELKTASVFAELARRHPVPLRSGLGASHWVAQVGPYRGVDHLSHGWERGLGEAELAAMSLEELRSVAHERAGERIVVAKRLYAAASAWSSVTGREKSRELKRLLDPFKGRSYDQVLEQRELRAMMHLDRKRLRVAEVADRSGESAALFEARYGTGPKLSGREDPDLPGSFLAFDQADLYRLLDVETVIVLRAGEPQGVRAFADSERQRAFDGYFARRLPKGGRCAA